MEQVKSSLLQSLQTGFIDKSIVSSFEYRPELLTNDREAGKKVLSTIDWELKNCNEFWISVAFVTTSGIATIMNTLLELQKKGVKGKVLVSQYLNFSQPEALKKLLLFDNIELKISVEGNFHSKGYLFRNDKLHDLIIGSSNLTANALCVNKEWNLKVSATFDSYIICNALSVFQNEFDRAQVVNDEFIYEYEVIYHKHREFYYLQTETLESSIGRKVIPNEMQNIALRNLEDIRAAGKSKALLISATGTGKTFLSAFDAYKFNPGKFLFVVHRKNIAEAAMKTFKTVFGKNKSMGFYSGNHKEKDSEFIFSTVQTISKDAHLNEFSPDHFDYIVIDESHHAGADSYKKIMGYFKPKFILGMTATPERTDGFDIFGMFDHTIAYEIRLHKAMAEDMLSPFHYFGITDIAVNGEVLDDKTDFNRLTSRERVDRVIENAKLYGCDTGIVRGLIFCSSIEECLSLSKSFNSRGFRTLALTGGNSDEERSAAINRLESDSIKDKLDYIFTVDIFNEGVDIPSVNQIILLRPTQSAIVFVQQLGRGLRKVKGKEYLTVIDFIGNYSNNYLVPIALYGDTTYNKDTLRKLMASGSSLIPGASTINFDEFSMKKIFESIDKANLSLKKDLVQDYQLLKFRLGRIPMMMDFIEQGARDPFQYVTYSKSYFNFLVSQEVSLFQQLTAQQRDLMELFSTEIANGVRVEEVVILQELLSANKLSIGELSRILKDKFEINISEATSNSCVRNINFQFVRKPKDIVYIENDLMKLSDDFILNLKNVEFKRYLEDALAYAISTFNFNFQKEKYIGGFILYQKYSRKDVCRILNWKVNESGNVFGYKISFNTCPIFVNYHKEEDIAASTKFPEMFLNNSKFLWYSKPNRKLSSKDIISIRNHNDTLRIPFFIKKHNGEGTDFYYMGDVKPIDNSFEDTTIENDKKERVPVVKLIFELKTPVESSLYNYITAGDLVEKPTKPIKKSTAGTIKKLPFKILSRDKVKPYVNSIPIYDISVAAGNFSENQEVDEIEWIQLPKKYTASKDYFVCKVVGDSMNKKILNDSWCLFKKDPGGSREGKIVLVQHIKIQDSDFGAGLTIKEYHSKKAIGSETWSHEEIILKPLSYLDSYKDIVLKKDETSELNVVGIFVLAL